MGTWEISQKGIELVSAILSKYDLQWERGSKRRKNRIYIPSNEYPLVSILIITTCGPVPGGGRGKAELSWWISEDREEDYVALVDLSTERIWLFRSNELKELAQQHSGAKDHLYMRTDHSIKPHTVKGKQLDIDFNEFLLRRRIGSILTNE